MEKTIFLMFAAIAMLTPACLEASTPLVPGNQPVNPPFDPPNSPGSQCQGPACFISGASCKCAKPCEYVVSNDPCKCETDWDCHHLGAFGPDAVDGETRQDVDAQNDWDTYEYQADYKPEYQPDYHNYNNY